VDLDRILEAQDAAGVDVVVLCAWVNLLGHEVGRQNEALAGMVGERVAALGTVDLERPELLVELMEDGRLRGVEIPAAPGGAYLGDARFRDFWAAAAQTGALVHDAGVLRGLVELFGADHVLCGSDYPFDMGVERPAEIVRGLGLPAEDEAKIVGGNALRLLGQERPA